MSNSTVSAASSSNPNHIVSLASSTSKHKVSVVIEVPATTNSPVKPIAKVHAAVGNEELDYAAQPPTIPSTHSSQSQSTHSVALQSEELHVETNNQNRKTGVSVEPQDFEDAGSAGRRAPLAVIDILPFARVDHVEENTSEKQHSGESESKSLDDESGKKAEVESQHINHTPTTTTVYTTTTTTTPTPTEPSQPLSKSVNIPINASLGYSSTRSSSPGRTLSTSPPSQSYSQTSSSTASSSLSYSQVSRGTSLADSKNSHTVPAYSSTSRSSVPAYAGPSTSSIPYSSHN